MFRLLTPKALWFALGVIPLVLLYILRTRKQKLHVASIAFFQRVQRDAMARYPWRRFVSEIALVLEILALLCVTLALSNPVWTHHHTESIVLIIDRSASMGAHAFSKNASTRRIDIAKTKAKEIVNHLPANTKLALISAGREEELIGNFGQKKQVFINSIDSIEPGLVEGDLMPALHRARDLLREQRGKRRVLVLSDGAFAKEAHWENEPNEPSLELINVLDSLPNVSKKNAAIIDVNAKRVDASHVEIRAIVAHYGELAKEENRWLTVRRIDQNIPLDTQDIKFEVSNPTIATLRFSIAQDGSEDHAAFAVELSPTDVLALDDFAHVIVPLPRKISVVLASLDSGGASWVRKALMADSDVHFVETAPNRLFDTQLDPWSVFVILDSCPKVVPGMGDILIIHPPPGICAGRTIGEAALSLQSHITSWSMNDSRLRYIDFDELNVGPIFPITASEGTSGSNSLGPAALVHAGQLTLIADASTLNRTVTLWGFDLAQSDLPHKANFVLMLRNIVDVARARRDRLWNSTTRAGLPIRVFAAANAKEVVARHWLTHKESARAPVLEETALLKNPEESGPFYLEGSAFLSPLTVSLLSERESDLTKISNIVDIDSASQSKALSSRPLDDHKQFNQKNLSWFFALLAAIWLFLDAVWFTIHFRRYRLMGLSH